MDYYYRKHVINEGGNANNVFKYTSHALDFSNRNQELLFFKNNENYIWFYSYNWGCGGNYTRDGKIINFWYKHKGW